MRKTAHRVVFQQHAAAVRTGLLCGQAHSIVFVCGHVAQRINGFCDLACGVVVFHRRHAAVGRCDGGLVAQRVVGIRGGIPVGVRAGEHTAHGVVGKGEGVAERIGLRELVAQRVKGIGPDAALRVRDGRHVVVGVVAEIKAVAVGVDGGHDTARGVVDVFGVRAVRRLFAHGASGCVEHRFRGVAQRVGNRGPAAHGVVAKGVHAARRIRHFNEQCAVVFKRGRTAHGVRHRNGIVVCVVSKGVLCAVIVDDSRHVACFVVFVARGFARVIGERRRLVLRVVGIGLACAVEAGLFREISRRVVFIGGAVAQLVHKGGTLVACIVFKAFGCAVRIFDARGAVLTVIVVHRDIARRIGGNGFAVLIGQL